MGAKARHSMQFQLLRYMSSFGRTERRGDVLKDTLFVIREELGEQTDRLHWHALVSGIKPSFVRSSTCLLSMGYWMGMGGGMTRIRTYNDEQDATAYVTKGLEDLSIDTTREGANRYEVGKFNRDDTLMLIPSHALLRHWKSEAFESGRLKSLAQARRRTARCDQNNHLAYADLAGVQIDANEWEAIQTELPLAGENPRSKRATPLVDRKAVMNGASDIPERVRSLHTVC